MTYSPQMKATIEAPLLRSTQEVLDVVRSGNTMYLIGTTGYRQIEFKNKCEATKIIFFEPEKQEDKGIKDGK